MENLFPFLNKDSFDIGVRYRGTYFAVNQTETKDRILIHSPLFGERETIIVPLFEGVSLCYCQIKPSDPICVLQNPTDPDMITLTFIVRGQIGYGISSHQRDLIQSGFAFLSTTGEEPAYNDIPAGADLLSVDLHLPLNFFSDYLQETIDSGVLSIKSKDLFLFPDTHKTTKTCFSPEIHHLFLQILNCPFLGNQRIFYLKMKTKEILFHYFIELQKTLNLPSEKSISNTLPSLRNKMYDLKDLLSSRHHNISGLAELSKMIGMSETTMQREFKKMFGFTIMQYHKKMILKRGLDLLQEGESIKNTAFLVGYSSSAAFSKAFYNEFGIRPSKL